MVLRKSATTFTIQSMTMKLNKWILGVSMLCVFASCDKNGDDLPPTTNADKDFIAKVAYADNAQVDEGNIAFTKTTLRGIKDFAATMVTDHNKSKGELASLAKTLGLKALPDMPDDAHQEMIVTLNYISGHPFDSTYMKLQVVDHQNMIDLFQEELDNGSDLRVKEFASTHLPIIQMHKHMADSLVTTFGF
jgi:putative membrane protein